MRTAWLATAAASCAAPLALSGACRSVAPSIADASVPDAQIDSTPSPPLDASDDAKTTAHARFELTFVSPANAGARLVRAVAPEIGLAIDVGVVDPDARCAARVVPPQELEYTPEARSRVLQLGCGTHLFATLSTDGSRLSVAGPLPHEQPVAPGVEVLLDPSIDDPADRGRCQDDATKPVDIAVRVVPVSRKEGRVLTVDAPAIGLHVEAPIWPDAYCHGHRWPRANMLAVECWHVEAGRGLTLRATPASLLVTEEAHSYDGSSGGALGGVALPCGARVHFPRVHFVDPGWKPLGNCRCIPVWDECRSACEEQLSDTTGSLTERGWACTKPCDAARDACEKGCFH